MPKINVMTEQEDKEQLADILFLLIAIECFVAFEFTSDIC